MKKHVFRGWRTRKNGPPPQGEAGDSHSVPAPPGNAQPTQSKGRLWFILLLCLLGSTGVSFVAFKYVAPYVLGADIPPELIGTWQVMEGDLQGTTLEFTWYGTATAVLYKNGKKETTNSTAKVLGKVLFLTSKDHATGVNDTVTQTILQLTEDELVIRDEDRHVYRMKRVRS
jgi:uncharacterized protein (TIGR03066 family)